MTDPSVAAYLTDVRTRLDQAERGERGRLINAAAEFLGCSRQSVYRQLQRIGWTSGRAQRSDANQRTVSRDQAESVAQLMNASRSAKGVIRLPVTEAVSIAQSNGFIPKDVSVDTVRRAMYLHRVHPELTRRSTWTSTRSLHPNHVWQLDPSICVLYYLDDGGLAAMSERQFYRNKPQNFRRVARDRVLRYVISDHTTGAFFVRYYNTPGENIETLFEFLMEAFIERPGQAFHGVPFNLIWDKGSANTSHAIQNVLDALAVDHWTHEVGNSRAKGQVESAQWLIETHFEARLAMAKVETLAELNGLVDTWQIAFNSGHKHARTGATRYGLWQTIRAEHLRTPPSLEICQELLTAKPQTRKVKGNLTIQFTVPGFEPAFYDLQHVDGVYPGQAVDVTVNPYKAPHVYVITDDAEGRRVHVECEPCGRDAYGFMVDAPVLGTGAYKPTRETELDQARKRQDRAAWGTDKEAEIDKKRSDREVAFGGAVDAFRDVKEAPRPEFMKRPGTELHVPSRVQIEERPLSIMEALKILKRELGRSITAEENTALREQYADGVPEDAIAGLIEQFSQPEPARPALSIVGGNNA